MRSVELWATLEVLEAVRDEVGVVTIYRPDFHEQPAVAGEVCATLAAVGIATLALSASFSSVSCVVSRDQLSDSVKVLKHALNLS